MAMVTVQYKAVSRHIVLSIVRHTDVRMTTRDCFGLIAFHQTLSELVSNGVSRNPRR